MENFLNFLADNYVYFFVGAGVMLFALIGFLVDLKKKNNPESETPEIPDLTPNPVANETLSEAVNNSVSENPEVSNTEIRTDEIIPAPEVPVEEPVENMNPIQDIPTSEETVQNEEIQ